MQKIMIPILSALAGATLALSLSHALGGKKTDKTKSKVTEPTSAIEQKQDRLIRQLFEYQSDMEKDFDTFFNDDFFSSKDPFETMRQFRKKMDQQFKELDQKGDVQSPFDTWFRHRFGGGSVDDIKQWADDKYLYYEITVDDIAATTLNTRVENGIITIEGETRKNFQDNKPGQNQQSFMSSRFTRSFPLPAQVDPDKMETTHEGNKIILKFPRQNL